MSETKSQSIIDNQPQSAGYKDPALSIQERVADLLSRMTIEEKVAQMLCVWGQKKTLLADVDGTFSLEKFTEHYCHGIGQIARLSDTNNGLCAEAMAELANRIQQHCIEHTRLGIPVVFHEECLHGLAAKDATSYPQPIGLASTFDPELVEAIYTAIAEDTRMRGAHQALTPVVDVARDPRWGRVEETFGEDPFLVGEMGTAAVKGFQGDGTFSDKKHVIATLKHFAAHGQPESGTNCGPVNVSERLLRDTFLYPFKTVLKKANPYSVMASYNEIDGVPSHANEWLLRDVLRTEWGFEGYVVSDYYAVTELNLREEAISHSVAETKTDAALLAVRAGVNIELPDPDCYPALVGLVRDGRVEEHVIDELVRPMLRLKFMLGLFEDPFVNPAEIHNQRRLEEGRALALKAAHETITLLKNDQALLPLAHGVYKTIAVIGPNADRTLLGGYSGKPKYHTTVLESIRKKVAGTTFVVHSEGCKLTLGGSWDEDAVVFPDPIENAKLIADAKIVAAQSDIVILALGGNEQTSREAWNKTHMGDRANLDLIGQQNDLLAAMRETGKPVVVLLFNGRPNSIGYVCEHADAILECWYLGQESGHAVADVLFGDHNPSGRLPISFPRSAGHLPCYYNYKPSARRGYLADDVTPLFPFGFGLSYTDFSFSNLCLNRSFIEPSDSVVVSVDVKNTGARAGKAIVQLYIRDVVSSVTRPVKELKGFKKIFLAPGESATVSIELTPEEFSFTNIDKKFLVEPGDFVISVGSSSRDEDLLSTVLTIT
jgi:beta-glucosidase